MEIKKTKDICKKMNKTLNLPRCYSASEYQNEYDKQNNRKWVAVNDLIKWINRYEDKTAFNEYQIRKTTLLKKLTKNGGS